MKDNLGDKIMVRVCGIAAEKLGGKGGKLRKKQSKQRQAWSKRYQVWKIFKLL